MSTLHCSWFKITIKWVCSLSRLKIYLLFWNILKFLSAKFNYYKSSSFLHTILQSIFRSLRVWFSDFELPMGHYIIYKFAENAYRFYICTHVYPFTLSLYELAFEFTLSWLEKDLSYIRNDLCYMLVRFSVWSHMQRQTNVFSLVEWK